MEKIISETRPVGNSSGVLLPREWLNRKVIVTLAEPSEKEILKEVLEILYDKKILSSVLGIYLVGSYARKEQTPESDIDILVVTKDIKVKNLSEGNYSLLVVSEKLLKEELKKNIFPLGPMTKEAKALMNVSLIEKYKNFKLTRKNLDFHIETTRSSIDMNDEIMKYCKELGDKGPDSVAYSLVLRLRGVYIVDCLRKKKLWKKKEFLKLLEKVVDSKTISKKIYQGYIRRKNGGKDKEELGFNEAEKLSKYILKKIDEQEKWIEKKD